MYSAVFVFSMITEEELGSLMLERSNASLLAIQQHKRGTSATIRREGSSFASMDVTFRESKPYFGGSSPKGESAISSPTVNLWLSIPLLQSSPVHNGEEMVGTKGLSENGIDEDLDLKEDKFEGELEFREDRLEGGLLTYSRKKTKEVAPTIHPTFPQLSASEPDPSLISSPQSDINECAIKDPPPCPDHATCTNLPGTYKCLCRPGYRNVTNTCFADLPRWASVVMGTSISILVLLICISFICMAFERKKLKKVRQKYFQQHGGWILFTEMKSKMGLTFTIFSEEELAEATHKFDQSRVLGHGGQGTVYKGTLKNNHTVAIKRCRLLNDEWQKKEFGKEMLILSEINHKNIVKLLGCCLQVEIPMLVYEFVPNGTLFQLIHGKQHKDPLSIGNRLRIAHESAEALTYLHSWASPPIIHGDVKSSNILLDEHYSAKVSDFGTSMLAPIDEVQFVTTVQGTCGCLDPEYIETYQLTEKSDVYSFGVVLLELLTGKKALYLEGPEEDRSLSSKFLSAMRGNRLEEILDNQIKNEEDMVLIIEVAHLATQCIDICGNKRPSMKEVADELGRLRRYMQHPWVRHNPAEMEIWPPESSKTSEPETSGSYILERKAVLIETEPEIDGYYNLERKKQC